MRSFSLSDEVVLRRGRQSRYLVHEEGHHQDDSEHGEDEEADAVDDDGDHAPLRVGDVEVVVARLRLLLVPRAQAYGQLVDLEKDRDHLLLHRRRCRAGGEAACARDVDELIREADGARSEQRRLSGHGHVRQDMVT